MRRGVDVAAEGSKLSHTPVTILTGFLGSGKTTLLNRALRDPSMANTAVVINEFGEVSLDHMLAARSDDTIMVLENGCLCSPCYGNIRSPRSITSITRARLARFRVSITSSSKPPGWPIRRR